MITLVIIGLVIYIFWIKEEDKQKQERKKRNADVESMVQRKIRLSQEREIIENKKNIKTIKEKNESYYEDLTEDEFSLLHSKLLGISYPFSHPLYSYNGTRGEDYFFLNTMPVIDRYRTIELESLIFEHYDGRFTPLHYGRNLESFKKAERISDVDGTLRALEWELQVRYKEIYNGNRYFITDDDLMKEITSIENIYFELIDLQKDDRKSINLLKRYVSDRRKGSLPNFERINGNIRKNNISKLDYLTTYFNPGENLKNRIFQWENDNLVDTQDKTEFFIDTKLDLLNVFDIGGVEEYLSLTYFGVPSLNKFEFGIDFPEARNKDFRKTYLRNDVFQSTSNFIDYFVSKDYIDGLTKSLREGLTFDVFITLIDYFEFLKKINSNIFNAVEGSRPGRTNYGVVIDHSVISGHYEQLKKIKPIETVFTEKQVFPSSSNSEILRFNRGENKPSLRYSDEDWSFEFERELLNSSTFLSTHKSIDYTLRSILELPKNNIGSEEQIYSMFLIKEISEFYSGKYGRLNEGCFSRVNGEEEVQMRLKFSNPELSELIDFHKLLIFLNQFMNSLAKKSLTDNIEIEIVDHGGIQEGIRFKDNKNNDSVEIQKLNSSILRTDVNLSYVDDDKNRLLNVLWKDEKSKENIVFKKLISKLLEFAGTHVFASDFETYSEVNVGTNHLDNVNGKIIYSDIYQAYYISYYVQNNELSGRIILKSGEHSDYVDDFEFDEMSRMLEEYEEYKEIYYP